MVSVWLGPTDDTTAEVFELLYHVAGQIDPTFKVNMSPTPELQLSHHTAHEWTALNTFFERSWFYRLWCFQEILVAKEARVVCGTFDIHWQALVDVLDALLSARKEYLSWPMARSCLLLSFFRASYHCGDRNTKHKRLSLMQLVVLCMEREAALPHDKIYGLLGCAQGDEIRSIPVDYQQHFRRLYTDSTRMFLRKCKDLSLLGFAYTSITAQSPRELPHWVPDYRNQPVLAEIIHQARVASPAILHGKDRYHNATGASRAVIPDMEDPFHLSLEGFRVGTITKTTEIRLPVTDESFVDSTVAIGGAWESLARECCIDGIYFPTSEPIELAYARTRVLDRLPDQYTRAGRRAARTQRSIAALDPNTHTFRVNKELPNSQDNSELTEQMLVDLALKKLFITDNGYFGISNRSSMAGDEIFLLLGGDMPFILRKLSTGTFQYTGEAYVHGIMQGEYLLRFRQDSSDGDAGANDEWLDSLGNDDPPPLPTVQVVLS